MLTKITTFTVMTLMSTASAAVAPSITIGGTAALPLTFPLYSVNAAASTGETYAGSGYTCIRRGFFYNFPQIDGSSSKIEDSTTSTVIRAFYPTLVA